MNLYQVIVSNVGTIYDGNDHAQAEAVYEQAKADSVNVIGRGAGEDVAFMYNGEPVREYQGVLSSNREEEEPQSQPVCGCVACQLSRAIVARREAKEAAFRARLQCAFPIQDNDSIIVDTEQEALAFTAGAIYALSVNEGGPYTGVSYSETDSGYAATNKATGADYFTIHNVDNQWHIQSIA